MLFLGSEILLRTGKIINLETTLTECSIDKTIADLHEPFTAVVKANDGVSYCGGSIVMGEKDITSEVFDIETGTISIPRVTGNITVVMDTFTSFENASWSAVKCVAQCNVVEKVGWKLGDTKPIEVGEYTYTARICDTVQGRYIYSDDETKTTNIVIEFVETYNESKQFDSGNTNANGWNGSQLKGFLNNDFIELLPNSLKNSLSKINIPYILKSGASAISKDNKIFMPSCAEIGVSGFSGFVTVPATQFQFYENNGNYARIKQKIDSLQNVPWWTRDVNTYDNRTFTRIGTDGKGVMAAAAESYPPTIFFAW